MSVTETNRKIITSFYQMLATGDFAGVAALFDETIVVHEPDCLPYGGIYRGMAEVVQLFPQVSQFLDISSFKIDTIVVDEDRAIGLFDATVRRTGERVPIAEESLLRNGKIVRVRVFIFDPTVVTKAIASQQFST